MLYIMPCNVLKDGKLTLICHPPNPEICQNRWNYGELSMTSDNSRKVVIMLFY